MMYLYLQYKGQNSETFLLTQCQSKILEIHSLKQIIHNEFTHENYQYESDNVISSSCHLLHSKMGKTIHILVWDYVEIQDLEFINWYMVSKPGNCCIVYCFLILLYFLGYL